MGNWTLEYGKGKAGIASELNWYIARSARKAIYIHIVAQYTPKQKYNIIFAVESNERKRKCAVIRESRRGYNY